MSISKTHSIERTSPKGELFEGVCVLCGAERLKPKDVFNECPNPTRVTDDEAVLMAIEPEAS